VEIIDGKESETVGLLGQIGQFMEKYLQSRDSLLDRARQQYQPMYEQKREQMMQKYGKVPNMSMDQDPEFVQMLQRNYNQLSNQYQQVLDQAKDQLKEAWSLTD
jgi:dsDNA-specific endonuclease/ATPase MutS2